MNYSAPFLTTLFLSAIASAQLPATPGAGSTATHHSLSLDATVTASGGASHAGSKLTTNQAATERAAIAGTNRAAEANYSSSRDKESGLSLSIEVRNLAQTPDTAKVEWYFVGKPVDKPEQFIFDSGSKEVTIAGGRSESIPVESSELASHEEKHLKKTNAVHNGTNIPTGPSASVKKSGSKVAGWMVRIVAEGKVLEARASSPILEDVAKNDTKLAAFPHKAK